MSEIIRVGDTVYEKTDYLASTEQLLGGEVVVDIYGDFIRLVSNSATGIMCWKYWCRQRQDWYRYHCNNQPKLLYSTIKRELREQRPEPKLGNAAARWGVTNPGRVLVCQSDPDFQCRFDGAYWRYLVPITEDWAIGHGPDPKLYYLPEREEGWCDE